MATLEEYERLMYELENFDDNVGLYCQSVEGGPAPYKERTDYMNGWNEAVMRYGAALSEARHKVVDEPWSAPERLFAADGGHTFIQLDNKWGVFLNDTWYWGCGDFEEIPAMEYESVAQLYRKYGQAGVYSWVFNKRGHMTEFDDNNDMIQMVLEHEKRRYTCDGRLLKDGEAD